MGKIVSEKDLQSCYPLADIEGFVPNHRITVDLGGHQKAYLVEVYTVEGLFWARSPEEDPVFASAPNAYWQCLTGPGRVLRVDRVKYQPGYVPLGHRDGHVYYIAQGSHVKVGWTQDVDRRLGELQVGAPERLELLATEPGTQELEKDRHRQFEPLRVSGEWFRHEGALKEHLASL